MKRSAYLVGSDVLGAGDLAVLFRLRDPGATVKAQGPAAALAYDLAPQAVTKKAYETIAQKFRDGAAAEKADVEVQVVSSPFPAAASRADIWTGAAIGAGGVGAGWLIWRFVIRGLLFRKK